MPSLTKKILKGKPYYYLRECQRVNGKPKIVWTMYLGSPATMFERLIRPKPKKVLVHEFGASAASFDIASSLDVVATIDRHVPKQGTKGPTVGQYLLLAALNRCVAPRSKTGFADWYAHSVLRRLLPMSGAQLSSQRFWDNMDRVDEKQIVAIERDLAATAVSRYALSLELLLFDATNFFTFVDSFNSRNKLAQRGHSKEGRDNLRIVGLALLVTADGEVPLFHHTYAGNQHDATTFGSVSQELANRCRILGEEVCDITLVFDKGNNSEANLEKVENGPCHFVGSLVPTQHTDLLAIPRKSMRRLDTKKLPAVWSYRTKQVVFGVERTVLCTYNQPLFNAQSKTLRREIAKRRRQLQAIQTSLENRQVKSRGKKPTIDGVNKRVKALLAARHMKELFKAEVLQYPNGLPRLTFQFQDDAWKSLCSTLLGKTILFTDRHDWSDEAIVLAYRAQSHVEAAFRHMKDPRFLTFRPTFHWTDQKLRVHAFYCVLALMLASLLRRKLKSVGIDKSIAKTMAELSGIHEVTMLYPAPPKSEKPFVQTMLDDISKEQQAMLKALDLNRYQAS